MGTMTAEAREALFTEIEVNDALALSVANFMKENKFRTIKNGIKLLMEVRAKRDGNDDLLAAFVETDDKTENEKNDKIILQAFRKLMESKGLNSHDSELEGKWYRGELMPSKDYAIKMCFAFGLSDISSPKTAGDFLFHICQINGFNYRVAEDIIYYYALVHDEDYEYAQCLISDYREKTINVIGKATSSTKDIENAFEDLAVMDKDVFMAELVGNAHNFIGYNKKAHDEFVLCYEKLTALVLEDIEKNNEVTRNVGNYTYSTGTTKSVEIEDEIIYEGFLRALTAKKKGDVNKKVRTTLTDIFDEFPTEVRISGMSSSGERNRDKATGDGKGRKGKNFHHGYVRKTFMLCFFAMYILDWKKVWDNIQSKTPVSFFNDFYRRLNNKLRNCSYGALYPSNPFDWLILKCAKLLDTIDPVEDIDITEVFNEILVALFEA